MRVLAGVDFSTKAEHVAFIADAQLYAVLTNPFTKSQDFAKRMAESPSFFDPQSYPKVDFNFNADHRDATELLAAIEFVVVETYLHLFDKKGQMAAAHWRIRTGVVQLGSMAQSEISAPEWKKGIGVHAHAKKEAVKERILQLYPELPGNLAQDCYDAVGIAHSSWNKLTLRSA